MAFVVTTGCCNDASCVDVCPVDCIRPHPEDPAFRTAEQLYIDPDTCIGCSACMYACPVSAIQDELDLPAAPDRLRRDSTGNYFVDQPLAPRFLPCPGTFRARPAPRRESAVIGTGPSGCYAIDQLSAVPGIDVTVFDRLPTPFGLVRFRRRARSPRHQARQRPLPVGAGAAERDLLPERGGGHRRHPRGAPGEPPRRDLCRRRGRRPEARYRRRGTARLVLRPRVRVLVQRASRLRGQDVRPERRDGSRAGQRERRPGRRSRAHAPRRGARHDGHGRPRRRSPSFQQHPRGGDRRATRPGRCRLHLSGVAGAEPDAGGGRPGAGRRSRT